MKKPSYLKEKQHPAGLTAREGSQALPVRHTGTRWHISTQSVIPVTDQQQGVTATKNINAFN